MMLRRQPSAVWRRELDPARLFDAPLNVGVASIEEEFEPFLRELLRAVDLLEVVFFLVDVFLFAVDFLLAPALLAVDFLFVVLRARDLLATLRLAEALFVLALRLVFLFGLLLFAEERALRRSVAIFVSPLIKIRAVLLIRSIGTKRKKL
jgi:hypothetical protein